MPPRDASPGHSAATADILGIGLFAKTFDRELIDSVLEETGRREQRVRILPAHIVVHLVLGLALHADKSYKDVVERLANGLQQMRGKRAMPVVPTVGAITAARTRLGSAPLVALFNRAAVPLASAGDPDTFIGGLRVVEAFSSVLNGADSPANAIAFGYRESASAPSPSALPQIRVVTLAEAGTQATIGVALGPASANEQDLAVQMIEAYLRPGMLLTTPRALFSPTLWAEALAAGADLLCAVEDSLALPVVRTLPDGTYLSALPADGARGQPLDHLSATPPTQPVRVLNCRRPSGGPTFRLISSALSPNAASAQRLLTAYAQRADDTQVFARFDAQHSPSAPALRSRKPDLVRQEIWAHLLSHYAIRAFISRATDRMPAPFHELPDAVDIALVPRAVDGQAPRVRPSRPAAEIQAV